MDTVRLISKLRDSGFVEVKSQMKNSITLRKEDGKGNSNTVTIGLTLDTQDLES